MQPTPSTPKTFFLGGLYRLQTGTKYLDQTMKDIKCELEACHGVSIQKISNDYVLLLTCCNAKLNIKQKEEKYFERCSTQKKNTSKIKSLEKINQNSRQNFREQQNYPRSKCTYFVKFSVLKNTMRPAQKSTYQLLDFNLVHDPECFDEQKAAFYQIAACLNSSAPAIEKVVSRKISKKQQLNSPKAIQEVLCTQLGFNPNFLQKDLPEGSCEKRRIKKKFDNMVAESKRIKVDPTKYIEKQQYAMLYPEAFASKNRRTVTKSKQQIESNEFQQQPSSQSPPQINQEQYTPRIKGRRKNFSHKSPLKMKNIDSQFQDKNQLQNYVRVEEKNRRIKFEGKQLKNVYYNLTPFKKEDQVLNASQIKDSQVDFIEVFSENPSKIQHSSNKEKMQQFEKMEIEQPEGSSDYSIEQQYYDDEKKAKVLLKHKSNKRKKKSLSSKTSGKVNRIELEQNSDKLSKTKQIIKIRNTKNSRKRYQVQQKSNNAQTTAKKTVDQEQE